MIEFRFGVLFLVCYSVLYFDDSLKDGAVMQDSVDYDKAVKETKKVTSVLQFFGWFRVWIFLLVTLGTVLFLTMTNELVKTTTVGNVFSSQVLVFALVLYLTNVGYDVVRELLPVEFQQYETDHTRFWIITLYLIFYNYNQHSYSEHFLGSAATK